MHAAKRAEEPFGPRDARFDPRAQDHRRLHGGSAFCSLSPVHGCRGHAGAEAGCRGELEAHKDSLFERFGNTNIKDSVARICLESSAKMPKFLIPTISENLARGGSIKYATLVIAAWCFYSDKGVDRHAVRLDIVDAMKDELHQAAQVTKVVAYVGLSVRYVPFRELTPSTMQPYTGVGVSVSSRQRQPW